jgi:hypothetical protein
MIDNTSSNEDHWKLLKQIYKQPQPVRNTTVLFGLLTEKNVSSPAQQQDTPVLPTTT